ncbi:phospholipase D-like domain-containing protein [Pseudomonas sp.]|uniref:phospholipase D-like domain-containing protein n=1 Tax=Pseudomonas sp. TaxID=306 RepID=UPI00272B13D8|nr:phospholipase D-like domain-containing protein [Pseudomonas sp.]
MPKRISLRYLPWLLALIAVALLVGNIIAFNALPLPKRMSDGLELEYGVRDPQFRQTLQVLLHNPIVPGNSAELLTDGEEIFSAMIEEISRAEHTVTFETYEFFGERAAGALAEALARAASRGVEVRALIDFIGSTRADQSKFELMEDAGVKVERYRAPVWYKLDRINYRTHRKILVVDGQVGFIGGANIADPWLPSEDGPGYRDHHFRLRGPIVAGLQATFAENWLNASGVLLEGARFFPVLEPHGDLQMQVLKSAPQEGRKRVRGTLLYALAAAQRDFTASTAYFYPDVAFLEALKLAVDRGVRVRILMPGGSMDKGFVRHASINRWREILEAGVELYEYQPSMYHAKLISVDDYWGSFGSANLDNRSFRINDEANVAVWDESFAIFLRELVESDLEQAERFTLDDWENRPLNKRLVGWVAGLLGAHY